MSQQYYSKLTFVMRYREIVGDVEAKLCGEHLPLEISSSIRFSKEAMLKRLDDSSLKIYKKRVISEKNKSPLRGRSYTNLPFSRTYFKGILGLLMSLPPSSYHFVVHLS